MIVASIGVAADDGWHDRRINHAQRANAPHAQLCINHGRRIAIRAHFAGADRVILRVSAAANILLQAGGIVDPRRVQHLATEPIERPGFDDALLDLGSLDQQFQIALI